MEQPCPHKQMAPLACLPLSSGQERLTLLEKRPDTMLYTEAIVACVDAASSTPSANTFQRAASPAVNSGGWQGALSLLTDAAAIGKPPRMLESAVAANTELRSRPGKSVYHWSSAMTACQMPGDLLQRVACISRFWLSLPHPLGFLEFRCRRNAVAACPDLASSIQPSPVMWQARPFRWLMT